MVTPTQAILKRPICPSCSKPVRLCLCSRIHNPGLPNSVSVTILQHSFEKKHPLNSARIARLGLKNVKVVTVFDVHFDARFVIRLLDPDLDPNGSKGASFDGGVGSGFCVKSEIVGFNSLEKQRSYGGVIDCDEECSLGNDIGNVSSAQNELGGVEYVENCSVSSGDALLVEQEHEFTSDACTDVKGVFDLETCDRHLEGQSGVDEDTTATTLASLCDADTDFESVEGVTVGNDGPVIMATIGKNGISSLTHTWMPQTHHRNSQFDAISEITEAREALAKGFVVQKLQRQPSKGNVELDEAVEFEVEVPPGSVLLFPSEEAVSASDLERMDIKVKNLIVLDGTWSKAKRMYVENPWLKLLPHLKLNLDKLSLYNEVRVQPKPGFLSTIESIVYALKAVGDSPEGLDNLLDVFESMVEDQRRCKEERISNHNCHFNSNCLAKQRSGLEPAGLAKKTGSRRPLFGGGRTKHFSFVVGKGGVTHNMLDEHHNHWKRASRGCEDLVFRCRLLIWTMFPSTLRNLVHVNVVDRVKETLMTEEVVRLDCTHAGSSYCKRANAKLAPCTLRPLLFKDEQRILWRGKQDQEQDSKCIHRSWRRKLNICFGFVLNFKKISSANASARFLKYLCQNAIFDRLLCT
ncbi:hypothetical protein ACLB2K_026058 [Fragaria x ananassa]